MGRIRSDSSEAKKRLSELLTCSQSDPASIYEQSLEVLDEFVPVGMLISFRVVQLEGTYHYDGLQVRGGRNLDILATEYDGSPILNTPTLQPRRPARREINQFQIDDLRRPGLEGTPLYDNYVDPLDVHSACRMLVYRQGQLAGWIGVHRRADQPMCNGRFRRRLKQIADPLRTALSVADQMNNDDLFDGELSAVLDPDGTFEHYSPELDQWLTRPRRASVADAVRRLDAGDIDACAEVISGVEVRISRLTGPQSIRYLAQFTPGRSPMLDPTARLTEAQREIAEFVAAGATNGEIAEETGRSIFTVKSHLRDIYEQLDVRNRVDLTALLADQ